MSSSTSFCPIAGFLSLALVCCETKDPGLEEEVSRLRQENGELTGQLESAEKAAQDANARVGQETEELREQLESAKAALQEIESRFDRKRLEDSFVAAVSDFKQETLKKFPNNTISQVTLHQMVMPSDHPFSSGVTLVLNDQEEGTSRTIHVKALGNIEGNWSFKKVQADEVAMNQPDAAPPVQSGGQTNDQNGSNLAGNDSTSPPGGGTAPKSPGVRRADGGAQQPAGGGKVYQIDWGD